jgi:hypothetical protein
MVVFQIAGSRFRLISGGEPISGCGSPGIGLRRTSSSRSRAPLEHRASHGCASDGGLCRARMCSPAQATSVVNPTRWGLPLMAVWLGLADAGLSQTF